MQEHTSTSWHLLEYRQVVPANAGCVFQTSSTVILFVLSQVPGGEGYDHNYVLFGMGPQAKYIVRNQAAAST
jgi:hypothetical protein